MGKEKKIFPRSFHQTSFMVYQPELGHMNIPRPASGEEKQDCLDYPRPIMIHSWDLIHCHRPKIKFLLAKKEEEILSLGEMQIWSLGWEDPLEEEMVTHSSILAWRIPGTEEPGGLHPMGLQRVEHDWACAHTDTHRHTHTHTHTQITSICHVHCLKRVIKSV